MSDAAIDAWLRAARAARLRHRSTADEVAAANRAGRALPGRFRSGDRMRDYAEAATATVAAGRVMAWTVTDGGAILVVRCVHDGDPIGSPAAVTDVVLECTGPQVALLAFGSPTLVRRVHDGGAERPPMYIFDGPARAMMDAFFVHLAKAQAGGVYATAYLHDAMVDLIGLQVAISRDGIDDPAALERFRADAGAAMLGATTLVRGYLYLAADEAEEAGEPDWYQFCIRRSAIELVRRDFPEIAGRIFDPDDLVRLDTELRRLGPNQEALPPHMIPAGLPPGHWWWRPPAATDDDPFALHL
jgi:hypothetical protein